MQSSRTRDPIVVWKSISAASGFVYSLVFEFSGIGKVIGTLGGGVTGCRLGCIVVDPTNMIISKQMKMYR